MQAAYNQGISARSVDDLVKVMGMSGISKSQVSRLCEEIDLCVKEFLNRPIEGDWPYLWIDATYVKVRQAGRIVSVAVTIAIGVNSDGRRKVLGMAIGASEAEVFWTEFLRSLARRGLRGVFSDEAVRTALIVVGKHPTGSVANGRRPCELPRSRRWSRTATGNLRTKCARDLCR